MSRDQVEVLYSDSYTVSGKCCMRADYTGEYSDTSLPLWLYSAFCQICTSTGCFHVIRLVATHDTRTRRYTYQGAEQVAKESGLAGCSKEPTVFGGDVISSLQDCIFGSNVRHAPFLQLVCCQSYEKARHFCSCTIPDTMCSLSKRPGLCTQCMLTTTHFVRDFSYSQGASHMFHVFAVCRHA